jgi:GNAT superfamily N-acetyltransferase
MCDAWMPSLQLPLTLEQFHQLPRNPAYKYEYLNGQVHLTPRGKHYHALLDLDAIKPAEAAGLRRLEAEDWEELVPLFAGAFRATQPFGSLDDATRLDAAGKCLERTRSGGDGPWIEPASFVARDGAHVVGAILLTLLPDGDPSDWDSYYWRGPPPADWLERRLGRPHLTWIFVGPLHRGDGIGTAMLTAAGLALRTLGYTQLASTFLLGNELSMLWHWRNGFRLLPYPGSPREMRKRWARHGSAGG